MEAGFLRIFRFGRFGLDAGGSAPARASGPRLLGERGIALGDLLGRLVDQTADAQRLILVGQADADIKIAVRLTVGLGQIASSLLRVPFSRRHLPAADRAAVFLSAHRAERGGLVRVAVEYRTADTAGQLRAVEAIFVRLHGGVIGGDALSRSGWQTSAV